MRKPLLALATILIIILVGFPGISQLLAPGYFTNHDGAGHIIRLQEFDIALKDGDIPPRLSKNLMYGYGYYFFNFNYPLVYYLGELAHVLGANFVTSINIVTVVTFILSGVLMFLWQKKHWGNLGGLVAGLFYMYAPYRFLNIYVRGSTAEHIAFVMLPLLFMFTEGIAEGKRRQQTAFSILGGLSYGLLMLSHNITAFIFTIILGLFMLFHLFLFRKLSVFLHFVLVGIVGLGVSAYFWVPSLLEKGDVRLDQTIGKDYPNHFVYLPQFWNSPWGFGSSVAGPNDGLSFQIGKLHLIFLTFGVVALFYLWKKQKVKAAHVAFYLGIFALGVFFMLSSSKPLWDHLPLLPFVQFPWRFLSWTVFATSVVAGASTYVITRQLKRVHRFLPLLGVFFIVAGLLFVNKNYWKVNQRVQINLPGDTPIAGSTTWADEQFPIWFEPKPTQVPPAHVEFAAGQGNVDIGTWKTSDHLYKIQAKTEVKVVENTAYYPGWQVKADDAWVNFDFKDPSFPGRLVYTLVPGDYTLESKFTETPLRLSMDILSVASLLAAAATLLATTLL